MMLYKKTLEQTSSTEAMQFINSQFNYISEFSKSEEVIDSRQCSYLISLVTWLSQLGIRIKDICEDFFWFIDVSYQILMALHAI